MHIRTCLQLALSIVLVSAAAVPAAVANKAACDKIEVRKEWRNLTGTEQQDYLDAAHCLVSLPSQTHTLFPNVTNRWMDFAAVHQNMTPTIHVRTPTSSSPNKHANLSHSIGRRHLPSLASSVPVCLLQCSQDWVQLRRNHSMVGREHWCRSVCRLASNDGGELWQWRRRNPQLCWRWQMGKHNSVSRPWPFHAEQRTVGCTYVLKGLYWS